MITGCASENGGASHDAKEGSFCGIEKTGSIELSHAKEFEVSFYGDEFALIDINGTGRYLLLNEGKTLPPDVPKDVTIIKKPLHHTYVAASSVMDLYRQLGVLSNAEMTSTKYEDWSIDEVKKALDDEEMFYVGKYGTPDFEFVLDCGCDLAIESTMIFHRPETKEKLETLGIPVLVEHSSYEEDPLGRLEWIKLYGLLNDRLDEAEEFFDLQEKKLSQIRTGNTEKKKVAFFAINPQGGVVVRRSDDYVVKMISMANGEYVPVGDESVIQMESFFAQAADADILIYNGTIYDSPRTLSEFTAMNDTLKELQAVKEKNVWCTDDDIFQKTTAICDMITEFDAIISGDADRDDMEYFYRLK